MLVIFLHLHSHLHFILARITSLTSNKFRNREQVTGEIKALLEWPLVVNLCCIYKAFNRWSCCIRLKTQVVDYNIDKVNECLPRVTIIYMPVEFIHHRKIIKLPHSAPEEILQDGRRSGFIFCQVQPASRQPQWKFFLSMI